MRHYDEWLVHDEPGNVTDDRPLTDRLLALLREGCQHGGEGALPREWLAADLGVSDRKLRATVEQLRRDGYPVGVGENGGYFLCSAPSEVAAIRDAYRKRIESECQTVNLMLRNYPEVAGLQLVLAEADGQGRLIA